MSIKNTAFLFLLGSVLVFSCKSGMASFASIGVYNGRAYVPGFMRQLAAGSLNKAIYWRDNEVITLPADSSAVTSDLALVPVP